jgi:hypothetical protein
LFANGTLAGQIRVHLEVVEVAKRIVLRDWSWNVFDRLILLSLFNFNEASLLVDLFGDKGLLLLLSLSFRTIVIL